MDLGYRIFWELGCIPWPFSSTWDFWDSLPSQEMLVDDWLEFNLSHLRYSQLEFGIPRKGLTLENWWDWFGGWTLWLSGVFQGFSDSRLEFQLG